MNRESLCEKYSAAVRLKISSPPEDWLAVFPDAATLQTFRREVGNLTFPEWYVQIPWEDAFSIAFTVAEGLSPSQVSRLALQLVSITPHHVTEARARLALLKLYGGDVPPALMTKEVTARYHSALMAKRESLMETGSGNAPELCESARPSWSILP